MGRRLKLLSATRRTRQLLTVFLCLQVLDVLTTLHGFRVGASESSPFISSLLSFGPVTGLVISKEERDACDEVWHQLRPPRIFYGR